MEPRPSFVIPATRNVILTGFMGTGKSSVGRLLARALGWQFVDTDDLIVQKAGKPIKDIFDQDGEAAFRGMEREAVRDVARLDHHVIATGGGMVVDQGNLDTLQGAGLVVLLEASPGVIHQRTRHWNDRPLLAGPDPQAAIEQLLTARREAYDRVPRRVMTDERGFDEIVGEILGLLESNSPPLTEAAHTTPQTTVRVELGERSYPIEIGWGWIDNLGERLAPYFPPRPCTIVTNPPIGGLHAGAVSDSLTRAGYRAGVCEIPEGEACKTIDSVTRIHDHMLGERHTRQSGVIALGGGVVGDVAGFAAATLLRGVACVQLPTSLLAMVDSSVGGKTGVNHAMGKNLIGAFWQPAFVGIDLKFLETLPPQELRAGLAEVIKYGIIADSNFFAYLEEHIDQALARDPDVLTHVIKRSCEIKAEVVGEDEREGGRRAILNFGHTFAHAAEALSRYTTVRHGEAVAMGMVAAMRLAEARGTVSPDQTQRVRRLVQRAGLPDRLLSFDPARYWAVMGSDKKVRDGRIRFVLPRRIGQVEIVADVEREEVEACLRATMDP